MPASIDDETTRALPAVRLTLTGSAASLRVGAEAAPLALGRLDAAMLAMLALEGATSRQRLLTLLWPDLEPESARNALRQRLFRLRRAAGFDIVHGVEQLALASCVAHDIDDGDRGDELASDELLAGHDFAFSPELEEWLAVQRRALRDRRRAGAADRIAACERDGRFADGARLAESLVDADALDEPALRQAMRLRYLAGQRGAALALFDRFVSALAAQIRDAEPDAETLQLLATVRDAHTPLPAQRHSIPASVLRPPWLVGRAAELAALALARDSNHAFWLLGEAGLGKSRLIAEFLETTGTSDGASPALVVAARPGDGGVPYATLGRALRALLERRPALLEHAQRHELARVMPEMEIVPLAGAQAGAHLMLHRAIGALLHDARRQGLLALVFDDLHFADSASIEMLQALVCDDRLAALQWGFAQRPAEGAGAVDALRAAFEESQRVDVIALTPLDTQQMAELITSLGLPELDADELAPQLVRHTGGNPMFALETLKHLLTSGHAPEARLPRPLSVGQLIERRLRQLTPQALALARVAAVAGVDFSIELAQAVLDTRALVLTDAWRELESAQVLRGAAFAHDLVHEATLAGVPAPIAAHTHGEVAAFLEAHGGEPARVATHWIDAGQAQRALGALHAAADAARHAMRRKEEAGFLERAARIESEVGDGDAAFESWRAMIDAVWVVDLTAIAESMFDQLDAAATKPVQLAAALALRANWMQECGRLEQAKRLARSAIDLADSAGDEATMVDCRQRLAHMLDWDGDYDGALALLQPLLPWAAHRASDTQRAEFYCRLGIALDNTDRGREARAYHQHALDACRIVQAWNGVVTVLGNLAISWATAGYMPRAIEVLREALQLAAAHDEARGCAASLPAEMFKSLRDCGRYADALRWVEPALAAESGMTASLMQCHVACGWMHLGQHARAQREIDAAFEREVPEWVRAKALQMRARLKFALGQRGAGALLDEALRIVRAQPGRRGLRASITLDHALTLESTAALAAAQAVIVECERFDLPGSALAGHIRAARFATDAQRADEAVAHARAALEVEDEVWPSDLYPAERFLQAWRAFRLAGAETDAVDALSRGAQWVRVTQRDYVPDSFRDSFVRANAVNQQLLRAAATSAR